MTYLIKYIESPGKPHYEKSDIEEVFDSVGGKRNWGSFEDL